MKGRNVSMEHQVVEREVKVPEPENVEPKYNRIRLSFFLKSGLAFLDQAILSATNFVISFILIKTVPKEEYGYYSIVFAISLFLVSLQNGLVTAPLTVLLPGKTREPQERYVAALYWGQLLVILPVVGLGLALTGVAYVAGLDVFRVSIVGSLCFASIGILLREFARAYYFSRESPSVVLKLDSCFAVSYLGLIALAYTYNHLSIPVIFVLMGVCGLLTSAFFNYPRWKFDWRCIRDGYKENWEFGRWGLLGVIVTHIQSYCNLYLTGSLLSSAAAGTLSASRIPFMPLSLVQTGWGKVVIPRGARLRESRQLGRFLKEQLIASAAAGVAIQVYVGIILLSSNVLKAVLLGKEYEGSLDLIVYWGAINTVSFVGLNASCGLLVMKEFGLITKVNCLTMLLTLATNWLLIGRYGIRGGMLSSFLGESLLAIALWWLLLRRYTSHKKALSELPGRILPDLNLCNPRRELLP